MHLLCLIRLISEVRFSIDKEYTCKNASKNPVQYFNIIMDVSSLIYKIVFIKRLWFNQEDCIKVFIYVQEEPIFQNITSSSMKVPKHEIFYDENLNTYWL